MMKTWFFTFGCSERNLPIAILCKCLWTLIAWTFFSAVCIFKYCSKLIFTKKVYGHGLSPKCVLEWLFKCPSSTYLKLQFFLRDKIFSLFSRNWQFTKNNRVLPLEILVLSILKKLAIHKKTTGYYSLWKCWFSIRKKLTIHKQ